LTNQYDATFRRPDWFFDTLTTLLTPLLAAQLNLTSLPTPDQVTQILLQLSGTSVCTIHEKYCLGDNQQAYSSPKLANISILPSMLAWHSCFLFHLEQITN
jgi:hypothetical protein